MAVQREQGGTSLIDVLDRVLDKGIVIDAWVRVSLVGIDLITVEARVVVASIDTYLKYSEAVGQVVSRLSTAGGTARRTRTCSPRTLRCARSLRQPREYRARKTVARGRARRRSSKDNRCSRRSPRPRTTPVVDLEASSLLAEFLLSSTDLQASARRAVDWLAAHTDVEQAVVAIHDHLSGQVLLVAEHGVSSAAIADFALSREDKVASADPGADPRREPTYFDVRTPTFHAPLDGAVPRHPAAWRGRPGLAGAAARRAREAPRFIPTSSGVARILGRQVARLLSARRRWPKRGSGRSGCCSTASSTRSPTRSC